MWCLGQKCWRIMILLLYLSSRKGLCRIDYIQYLGIGPMFDESTKLCELKYKVVFLGHSAVGKSALIERFIYSNFDPNKNETVGIDFMMKNVTYKGAVYRLQLWDTAGQQKFKSLVPNYIRDAHCAVFVYDCTRLETLKGIDSWFQLFKQHHSGEAASILVGNKVDLQGKREASWTEGESNAMRLGVSFCETSACTGKGVEELFHSIIQNIEVAGKKQEISQMPLQQTGSRLSGMSKSKVVKLAERRQPTTCCYI